MGTKILIVDDSSSDRLIISNMLREYETLTANDGLEAMAALRNNEDIDLIILDLNMPNMDGFSVLEELNSKDSFNHIRTIILTNYDEIENEIKGLRLGAIDYIRKPIHMESLKVRIDIHVKLLEMQKIVEQELSDQSFTYNTVFNQAPIGIAILKNKEPFNPQDNDLVTINPKFQEIIGLTKKEILEEGLFKLNHPDDIDEVMLNYKRVIDHEVVSFSMDNRFIRPDGSILWVHLVLATLNHSEDTEHRYILLVQNITQRKEIEKNLYESERSKSVLLSHLPGMAYRCKFNRDWTMEFVSQGCFELTGYSAESMLRSKDIAFNEIIAGEYTDKLWEEWTRVLGKREQFNYEYEIITADGERKWVLELGQGIFNSHGEVEALEGIILDITQRKNMELRLRYNTEHDLLTGLFNGNYLKRLLKEDKERLSDNRRALIGINLSDMDSLTTAFGFQYTLDLRKKIAEALETLESKEIILVNTFEIQFVFYFRNYMDEHELEDFCKRVVEVLESLLVIERVGGGIGIVEMWDKSDLEMDQLLRNLLIASENSLEQFDKDFGISYFDNNMFEQVIREEDIKRELTMISVDENDGGLYLLYQPILDLKSNKIYGFEALARVKSDKLGLISPLEFIPIAEKTKLIVPIGEKIIKKGIEFLRRMEDLGCGNIYLSINISAIQLLRTGFVNNFVAVMEEYGVNPNYVGIELTESIFASDYDQINNILGELRELGIKVAIDDFGTGYSSLARERELNINCLKIDKQFIDKIIYLKEDEAITGDIISLAHKLGHYVIAEGVEDEIQRRYLEKYNCDLIQGYLISKPLFEEVAIQLLIDENGKD